MNANSIWNTAGTRFPVDGDSRQKLGHAVKCAGMTMPLRDRQPWQVKVEEDAVELFASFEQPPDFDERSPIVHCGEALFHLKLALKYFGCLGQLEFFPDLARPNLATRIHIGSGRAAAQEERMFEAMTRAHDTAPLLPEMPLHDAVLETIQTPVAGGKAWLEFSQCEASRSRLEAIIEASPQSAHRNPSSSGSFAQWTRPLLTFIIRASEDRHITVESASPRVDDMAALALIKTKTDDKHGWLAAGQALARAGLQARSLGISSQVFDLPFRERQVREELRTGVGHKGFAQAIIGIGRQDAQWPVEASAELMDDRGFESDAGLHTRL